MGPNEHMEGTVLIFSIELLFLEEEHSNIPIEYEFTFTGLTAGELLFHSLCMHVQIHWRNCTVILEVWLK